MAGRPRAEIDKTQFEKLCAIQCTKDEICSWFNITDKTLEKWCNETYNEHFSEVFAKKRGLGKISLRRSQWHLAEKSAAMAIFLGKNYLGQSDSVMVQSPQAESAVEQIAKLLLNKKQE